MPENQPPVIGMDPVVVDGCTVTTITDLSTDPDFDNCRNHGVNLEIAMFNGAGGSLQLPMML